MDPSKPITGDENLVPSYIVDKDRAIQFLGVMIDLTKVSEKEKEEVKGLIQGRLRRVFGFIS